MNNYFSTHRTNSVVSNPISSHRSLSGSSAYQPMYANNSNNNNNFNSNASNDGSMMWLSPERRQQHDRSVSNTDTFTVVEQGPSPSRDIERFQSLKRQLEHFREATDPKIAIGLGIEGPAVASAMQNQNQPAAFNFSNNFNNSNNIAKERSTSANSASLLLQPPGLGLGVRTSLSPAASQSRAPSTANNNNNNNNNNNIVPLPQPSSANTNTDMYYYYQQQNQQQQMSRPPTVVQADGSFRFLVPPNHQVPLPNNNNNTNKTSTKPNFRDCFYNEAEEEDEEQIDQRHRPKHSSSNIQTVSLKGSANYHVNNNHNNFNNTSDMQDLSAISPASTIHPGHYTNQRQPHDGFVGRTLFDNNNVSNVIMANSPAMNHGVRKVATQEKPAWIGPLDQNSSNMNFSDDHRGNNNNNIQNNNKSTPSNRQRRTEVSSPAPTSVTNNFAGKNEVHVLQDGRRVVFKGTTHQRLLEEALYTGQSKIRFAWKYADMGGDYQNEEDYHHHFNNNNIDEEKRQQHYPENPSDVIVDDDNSYFQDEESYYHNNNNNNTSAISPRITLGNSSRKQNNNNFNNSAQHQHQNQHTFSNFHFGSGGVPPPKEPAKVLNLMKGTSIAADQFRRAKTEGERRTAHTLMRRQAWKALHPGAMEWEERTWKDTLRPSARSGRGGADDFDDAKNFSVYKQERPQWKFPARHGPTMQELKDAPVVVHLSLEDLKVTPVEERVLEHMSSQRRNRYQQVALTPGTNNNQRDLNGQTPLQQTNVAALVKRPVLTRCDEPPPTPNDDGYYRVQRTEKEEQQEENGGNNLILPRSASKSIRKTLPVESSMFAVRNSNNAHQNRSSPIINQPWQLPSSSGDNSESENYLNTTHNNNRNNISAAQRKLVEQHEKRKEFILPSRAVRDAMASFGDPTKTAVSRQPSEDRASSLGMLPPQPPATQQQHQQQQLHSPFLMTSSNHNASRSTSFGNQGAYQTHNNSRSNSNNYYTYGGIGGAVSANARLAAALHDDDI